MELLLRENAELKYKIQDYKNKIMELESQVSEYKEQIEELTEEIEDLRRKFSEIPLVGAIAEDQVDTIISEGLDRENDSKEYR